MDYPREQFDADERASLERHFTSLESPVFGLVNLPEAVKGALFARYSRYPGTLRRLFLDEFAGSLPEGYTAGPKAGEEGERASQLYERVFVGFGDDSVAQLGGAHIACEWCSNLLTKLLQRPRLAAYLEQSTRYIAYDDPVEGLGYRYYREPSLGPEYERAMTQLFEIYSEGLPVVARHVDSLHPRAADESEAAHARAVKAKSLDLMRGLLPASSLSHMGIYATGQTYEQLILHLMADPSPEARRYGTMLLEAVKSVMPSFVSRVERPERGGSWVDYLRGREAAAARWAARLGIDAAAPAGPAVRLLHVDGDEIDLLTALLYEAAAVDAKTVAERVSRLSGEERVGLLRDVVGERENRRHKPGRGLEALRYRFEVFADYGAFRDLQRHRLLTVQWQRLSPDLGADVPEEVDQAGYGDRYREALELSAREYQRLEAIGHPGAPYAVCLAYRLRFVLDLNARAAMHLIELRSGVQGHPSYRAVAHEMHRLIGEVHPMVAAMMSHVDQATEPRLERLLAEIRNEVRG